MCPPTITTLPCQATATWPAMAGSAAGCGGAPSAAPEAAPALLPGQAYDFQVRFSRLRAQVSFRYLPPVAEEHQGIRASAPAAEGLEGGTEAAAEAARLGGAFGRGRQPRGAEAEAVAPMSLDGRKHRRQAHRSCRPR